jgi:hypothetical protein
MVEARDFSLPHIAQTAPGTHSASYTAEMNAAVPLSTPAVPSWRERVQLHVFIFHTYGLEPVVVSC